MEFNDFFKVYIVKTKDNTAFLLNENKQLIENSLYDKIEINTPEIIATKSGEKLSFKFENDNLVES